MRSSAEGRHRGVRPDGAADLAHADRGRGGRQAGAAPPHLVDPEGELQPEGHRLGVDAVRAAHHQGVLVLARLGGQDRLEPPQFGLQQRRRVAQLQRRGRVPDVRRGQPQVHPAPLVAQGVRDGAQERGHVVVGLRPGSGRGPPARTTREPRWRRRRPAARPPRRPRPARRRPRPATSARTWPGRSRGRPWRAGVAGDHGGRRAFRCAGVVPGASVEVVLAYGGEDVDRDRILQRRHLVVDVAGTSQESPGPSSRVAPGISKRMRPETR